MPEMDIVDNFNSVNPLLFMNPHVAQMGNTENIPLPPGLIKPIPNGVFNVKKIGKRLSKQLRSNIKGSFTVIFFFFLIMINI